MESFKELFIESRRAAARGRTVTTITFEITDENGVSLFRSDSGSAADQVERKLKTKKFQKLQGLKVTRYISGKKPEDVTSLFIK